MPSVEAPRGTDRDRVSNAPTVSSGAGAHPSSRAGRANRLPPKLRDLLAGLNELLRLSDFSRGDVFRD